MTDPVFEITKAAGFDAAHHLEHGTPDNPYRRLHGHSFLVEATVRGPMHGEAGWVADLGALDAALKAAAGELDHAYLNEKPGLETPTLERLCLWFSERLRPDFPGLAASPSAAPPSAKAARSRCEGPPTRSRRGCLFLALHFLQHSSRADVVTASTCRRHTAPVTLARS